MYQLWLIILKIASRQEQLIRSNKACYYYLFESRGVTPLYKLYRYVPPPQRVGLLCRFGLKTGIHFAHFGLESGMVFEGTTEVYERSFRFNSK